jgi:hypothetical protein
MNIAYTYEIVSVDEAARCMEVVYTSDGQQTMRIGARLPFEGENLEAVVRMYAPVAYWQSEQTPVVAPAVGTTGSVSPPTQAQQEADAEAQANARMWEQLQFEKRVAKALVKFGVLQSDPTEIPVTQL